MKSHIEISPIKEICIQSLRATVARMGCKAKTETAILKFLKSRQDRKGDVEFIYLSALRLLRGA